MSGKNLPINVFPPGLVRTSSQYATRGRWWDGNMIRWHGGVPAPIGGWYKAYTAALGASSEPWRAAWSWRDNNFIPWMAVGSADKAMVKLITDDSAFFDITPVDLAWAPGEKTGYGGGSYGVGKFGKDTPDTSNITADNYWCFHSWGEDLIAVHSLDGRLLKWSPVDPAAGTLTEVATAPADNILTITTDERHCMVMGGAGNPRRVKWCSQEDIDDWTPTATNTAGGFELDTHGSIICATKVPQGILVFTDVDVHLIEYVGADLGVYSRRQISDITGILGPFAYTSSPNGVIFAGPHSFWVYNGGVTSIPCDVHLDVFDRGQLNRPVSVFMGFNEEYQETWFFYPQLGAAEANRFVVLGADGWWSKGNLSRRFWLSPVWQAKPYAGLGADIYGHEVGWLNDGSSRNSDIYIESGVLEINNGDRYAKVDRVYHDFVMLDNSVIPANCPYSLTFKTRKAPTAAELTYGPVTPNNTLGFTTVRFQGRQVVMRVNQTSDIGWGLGELRARVKEGMGR
jgi:hypothetical protein